MSNIDPFQSELFRSDSSLAQRLFGMPKVDLHRHLTGSIDAETAVRVAAKYGVTLPTYITADLHRLLFERRKVGSLREYFEPWEILNRLFVSSEAVVDIVLAAAERAARDNVVYLELRTSPRGFLGNERLDFGGFLSALETATGAAERQFGIVVRWVLGVPRHVFGPIERSVRDRMFGKMVAMVQALYPAVFVGVDLNGDELSAGPEEFRQCFAVVRQRGLEVTIHAGEVGAAESVRYAVVELGASRVGHGIRAADDPSVLGVLAERGSVLEICPTSNEMLGVVSGIDCLPLRELTQAGVRFVICTDNPARCRTSLSEEWLKVAKAFDFDDAEIRAGTEAAIASCFAEETVKAAIRARVAAYWKGAGS